MLNRFAAWAGRLPLGAVGVLCGAGAAFCWAAGLVSARHGIAIGLTPLDIALHRMIWAGFGFLPFMCSDIVNFKGVGWRRGFWLTLCGGPPLALLSYAGFMLVPLGHGGVIQPSCAALGGLLLATLVVKEKLPVTRLAGAVAIVCGLCVIGYEALATIGVQGILGDLMFMAAGFSFAAYGLMLKMWRITPIQSVAITSVLSLVLIPVQFFLFGFDKQIEAGFYEIAILVIAQGLLAGAAATFLCTRAVVLRGAARAAVFPALVPPFTLLTGFLALGIVPTLFQLAGMVVVLFGFRLTQKA
jgi:drug/metabolite transporter (DMT)-like permease